MSYVLYEPFSSDKQGNALCLRMMTAIGPCASGDPDEWMRFDTKEQAARHPAALHSLTFYEAVDESEIASSIDEEAESMEEAQQIAREGGPTGLEPDRPLPPDLNGDDHV